jgi:hypothetical protein
MTAQTKLGDVLLNIEAGKSSQTAETMAHPNELGVLKVSAVTWSEFQPKEAKALRSAYTPAQTHRVKGGNFIISRANTKEFVGAVVLVGEDYPNRLLSDKTLRLVVDERKASKEFLLFALRSKIARDHIEELATGTSDSMRNISHGVIRSIPIPFCDLDSQRSIAASLKAQLAEVETARAAVTAQLCDVQALTDAIYKETFCHITPTSGPTPMFPLPEGWTWQKFEEIAQINPRRPAIERSDDAATSFVPMEAVDEYSGTIAVENIRKFQKVGRGYTYFENGDVIFAKITPCMQNGKHAVVADLIDGIGFGSTEFHVIRALDGIVPEWIHLFLRWNATLAEAKRSFTGAVGQQRVPTSFLENLQIPIPPPNQRVRLAGLANKKLEEVEALRLITLARLAEINLLPQKILSAAFEM